MQAAVLPPGDERLAVRRKGQRFDALLVALPPLQLLAGSRRQQPARAVPTSGGGGGSVRCEDKGVAPALGARGLPDWLPGRRVPETNPGTAGSDGAAVGRVSDGDVLRGAEGGQDEAGGRLPELQPSGWLAP